MADRNGESSAGVRGDAILTGGDEEEVLQPRRPEPERRTAVAAPVQSVPHRPVPPVAREVPAAAAPSAPPAAPQPNPSTADDDWDPTVAYRAARAADHGAPYGGVASDGPLAELQAALDAADWDRAEEIAAAVLAEDPDDAGALHGGGIAALNRGDTALACDRLEHSLRQVSDNADWHHNLAIARLRAGRPRAAESSLRRALRLAPERSQSLALLGLLLIDVGDFEEAAILFERAVANDTEPTHLLLLLDATVRAGFADRVERTLTVARERWPDDDRVLQATLLAFTALGRDHDALLLIEERRRGQAPLGDTTERLLAAGRIEALMLQGRTKEASAASERLLTDDPAIAAVWHQRARALGALGRAEEALASMARSVLVEPANPARHLALSTLFHALGHPLPALVHADITFRLSDRTEHYTQALVLRLRDAGRLDEATVLCRQWHSDQPDHPEARFLSAALSGTGVPARMPDATVRWRYDRLDEPAEDREPHPAVLDLATRAAAFTTARLGRRPRVLDLGSGRGRIGLSVRPEAAQVTGVDLSARFALWSRHTGAYDRTLVAEAEGYLFERQGAFDLVVAEGLLPFLGPPHGLFRGVARALAAGGVFLVTCEPPADDPDRPWRLCPSGRYAHGAEPTIAALEAAGFTIVGEDLVGEDGEAVLAVLAMLE